MSSSYEVTDFGAVSDGKTLCTEAIQRAIDTAHGAGGGVVSVGPGPFLTGSIELKSGVELRLETGSRLVGSTDLADYEDFAADGFNLEYAPERSVKSLIHAVDAHDIAITGPGEIDGSGPAFYDTGTMSGRFYSKPDTERPRMVMMYGCSDIRFEGAAFTDSPCWTFWLMKCEHINIHRVRIRADQRMINNDGIDIDSCRNVTISDCIMKTGDDCIVLRAMDGMFDEPAPCENVTVTNCVLDSWCQALRLGCPSDGTIRNAVFSNLVLTSENHGISIEHPKRYLVGDDTGNADMHDIEFTGLVIQAVHTPIRVLVEEGIKLRRLSDLSFSHIRAQSGGPFRIEGSTETPIHDVTLSNVRVRTTGEDAVSFRHCEGLRLDQVSIDHRS